MQGSITPFRLLTVALLWTSACLPSPDRATFGGEDPGVAEVPVAHDAGDASPDPGFDGEDLPVVPAVDLGTDPGNDGVPDGEAADIADGPQSPEVADTADAPPPPDVPDLADVPPIPDTPPDLPPDPGTPDHCGNGFCEKELGEKASNCPADCCECGDCKCNLLDCGEDVNTCPTDCEGCGDKVIKPGESPICCPLDACYTGEGSGCGDGICMGPQCDEDPVKCPSDCGLACGNGTCDKGENPSLCPDDCQKNACGNGTCDFNESPQGCPEDCKPSCGNCACDGGEDYMTCPVDCGYCGDGICSQCVKESKETCPRDCG
jgi:hypothetical protein